MKNVWKLDCMSFPDSIYSRAILLSREVCASYKLPGRASLVARHSPFVVVNLFYLSAWMLEERRKKNTFAGETSFDGAQELELVAVDLYMHGNARRLERALGEKERYMSSGVL